MGSIDLLIIIAEGLPFPQAMDLVAWWLRATPRDLMHPSFEWWAKRNAGHILLRLQLRRLEAGL